MKTTKQREQLYANGIKVLSTYQPETQIDFNKWILHVHRTMYEIAYGKKNCSEKKLLTRKLNFTR